MSQIDFVNFLPHIFWFLVLGLFLYFLIFSLLLPMIFEILFIRKLFFYHLISMSYSYGNLFFYLMNFLFSDLFKKSRFFFFSWVVNCRVLYITSKFK